MNSKIQAAVSFPRRQPRQSRNRETPMSRALKYLFRPLVLLLLVLLLLAAPAYAQGSGGIDMLIVDTDPKGTNVRDAPGGKVTRTVPFGRTDEQLERRRVMATEAKGQWFRVTLGDGGAGWMHTSVLGTCASATEDGDPTMYTKPDDRSPAVGKVKDGTKLRLLDVQTPWAKVETAGSGAKQSGWMMEHTLFSNPFNSCWE